MKFDEIHVGDQVMIADRDTLATGRFSPNVVSEMLEYAGRIVTVTRIDRGRSVREYINIAEDRGLWNWPIAALLPIISEEIAQPDSEEFTALLSALYGT